MELIQGLREESPLLTITESDLKDKQRWLEILLIFAELARRANTKQKPKLRIC